MKISFHFMASLSLSVSTMALSMPTSLIINNKGGGHVTIGYHLCRALTAKGHKVTIIQNSDIDNEKMPFTSYSDLDAEILKIPFDETFALPEGRDEFDFVFDNNSKAPTGPVESAILRDVKTKLYTYVGSAGIYERPESLSEGEPLDETMPIKVSKPTAQFEAALAASSIPHVLFRCQYIYGPLCPKKYLDYYLDRISKEETLPIPSPGTQIVSLTDVRDVASQLASVVDGPLFPKSGEVYNTGTTNDLKHTYVDVAKIIGGKLGKKPKIELVDEAPDFPFRAKEFFVNSKKSITDLDFDGGKMSLESYVGELVDEFQGRGK